MKYLKTIWKTYASSSWAKCLLINAWSLAGMLGFYYFIAGDFSQTVKAIICVIMMLAIGISIVNIVIFYRNDRKLIKTNIEYKGGLSEFERRFRKLIKEDPSFGSIIENKDGASIILNKVLSSEDLEKYK